MAAEFVVFPTLLPVTQPGGSDNPCTRIKMSQETATSTPVCKMVIQRCLRQSERFGGWNCRTLNPLTRDRTGDEMKTLSPSPQYLSHYEQNTSGHKKSPQKRNASQLRADWHFFRWEFGSAFFDDPWEAAPSAAWRQHEVSRLRQQGCQLLGQGAGRVQAGDRQ